MQLSLFTLLGIILIFMGVIGLLTGSVMVGSRGLKPNFYNRANNPVLYYAFIIIYIVIGSIVIINSV